MKKQLLKSALVALASVGLMAGSAFADPTSWTDTVNPNPDVLVNAGYTYIHDISDDGFTSYLMGGDDLATSYMLTVALYDDKDKWYEKAEIAVIDQPGLLGDGLYNFNYTSQQFGYSLAGLISINIDGQLDVTITSWLGDFVFDYSVLTVYGDNGSQAAPVPEPATMLLFGTGLASIAGVSRRKAARK